MPKRKQVQQVAPQVRPIPLEVPTPLRGLAYKEAMRKLGSLNTFTECPGCQQNGGIIKHYDTLQDEHEKPYNRSCHFCGFKWLHVGKKKLLNPDGSPARRQPSSLVAGVWDPNSARARMYLLLRDGIPRTVEEIHEVVQSKSIKNVKSGLYNTLKEHGTQTKEYRMLKLEDGRIRLLLNE